MAQRDFKRVTGGPDVAAWRSHTADLLALEEDAVADVDEPPERLIAPIAEKSDFHRLAIRPQPLPKESLLTKALASSPESEVARPSHQLASGLARQPPVRSLASSLSTADLISDDDLTSPARTSTPSPPLPEAFNSSFASFSLGEKPSKPATPHIRFSSPEDQQVTPKRLEPRPDAAVEALVKKRCISFACAGQKPKPAPAPMPPPQTSTATPNPSEQPKRTCTIRFACGPPQKTESSESANALPAPEQKKPEASKTPETSRRHSRSPSTTRKLRPSISFAATSHRDSMSTIRPASRSPEPPRTARKPSYLQVDESSMNSESTRFHEFASGEVEEDDWVKRDDCSNKEKITINDTLKKENAIRQIGKEAEEEAEEEEEYEDELDDLEDELEDDLEDDDDDDEAAFSGADEDDHSGNETDNEAGFADSDDENDSTGDQFWTPSRQSGDVHYRVLTHKASESSIDSLKHMSPKAKRKEGSKARRIKIRPGTPELPDSTDFVCGTLDEDRPLEEAYVSCMEARKREKQHIIPQDIDPSFPTSDPENDDDDEDDIRASERGSGSEVWLHGKFEDSNDDEHDQHRPRSRKSPAHSPKRLRSPPPKQRLRSPPPRRLFGAHSPKRLRSPPPARAYRSPAASPTAAHPGPIPFAPLGQRPGLTHTKSLPRTPNAFAQAYRASRLAATQEDDETSAVEGHSRGAIDIVKGLERKRERRKEKFWQKHCNRARKAQQHERRPQPGKGAQRMRELGLQMAGINIKTDARAKPEYVLSI